MAKENSKYNGIFKTIDNDNTAYWLGFLAADGSIHKNRHQLMIGLSRKDRPHLEKFIKFIESDVEINDRNMVCSTNGKSYPSSLIHIYNKELVDDLAQYYIIANKSNQNIDFLKYIPEPYKIYFVLGYFDGDGFYTNTEKSHAFGWCGCEANINSITQYAKQYFNLETQSCCHPYKRSPTTYEFTDTKINDIKLFCEFYLNQLDKVDLLQRKAEIAKQLYEFATNKLSYNPITKRTGIKRTKRVNAVKKIKICPICHKEFYALGKSVDNYCSQICAHIAQRKTEWPSRDELKSLIRNISFLQIGKRFNVSDNTIRKWCKHFGLPYKAHDIKKYTDEEWNFL